MMNPILEARMEEVRLRGLHREPKSFDRRNLDFSSNDYLALATHRAVVQAAKDATEQWGAGARAARLMSGTLPLHEHLEAELAAWQGQESALLFGSGFLANSGIIPALARKGDVIFADKLVHASAIEGIRLSEGAFYRFRHNDLNHLQTLLERHQPEPGGLRLIVTESVFSMDGDLAPLEELMTLAKSYGENTLTLIDEAHAIGIYGRGGAGRCSDLPSALQPDLIIGTLGKALGSYGGFCTCSHLLRDYLVNFTRTFIFSTALPPSAIAAAATALSLCRKQPLGQELLMRARHFAQALNLQNTQQSQIIPIIIGENTKALQLAEDLRQQGILVTAIRPPTVPPGTARLRLSVTLAHSTDDLQRTAEIIRKATANLTTNL